MRILLFLKKFIITALCLAVLLVAGGFLCTYSYARVDQAGQELAVSGHALISDNFYTDITPNGESVASLQAFISSLAPNVSNAFCEEWKVVISTDMPSALLRASDEEENASDPAGNTAELSVLGYSNWHLRVIYLKAQPDPEAVYRVFAHEMGHYFDYEFGSPSSSKAFSALYSVHKDSFTEADLSAPAGYATSSPKEFFATVFKEYFLFPEHLMEAAPDVFSFFDNLYNDISTNPFATTTLKYDLRSAIIALGDNMKPAEDASASDATSGETMP